jgi:replicative DNA helicase
MDGGVHWGKYLKDLYEEIEDRFQNPREIWGIPTRFSDFDFITGGLQSGESVVISGNPGIGKSMLTFQMCTQLAETVAGAVYSLEMSGVAVSRRALSAITNVKSRNLKKGTLEPDDWSEIAGGISKLDKLPIIMSDNPNWTTAALQSDLFRLKRDYGVKWFMVDYMTLLGDARSGEEYERLGDISRAIKLICRRLDLAGLLIHSMTKSGMDSAIPSLTALRGEAGVSFDADLILFLTKFVPQNDDDHSIPAGEQENMRTLIFGKGRELENPRKYIHLVKSPDYPNFREYAQKPEVQQYVDWSK